MAVDRGGLQYTIEVRDKFSATTQAFRKEMRESRAAFRDFQNTLKIDKQAARQLKTLAETSKAVAQANRERASSERQVGNASRSAQSFEDKRLRTIRNLLEQAKLLRDEEVRKARDVRRAATAEEKAASAIEQKARALKESERAAKAAERAERRLQELRERQARTDVTAGERAQQQARQRELAALRNDIQQRAAAQQQAADEQLREEQQRLRRLTENERTRDRLAAQQRRAQAAERREAERAARAQERIQERLRRDAERRDPRLQAQRQLNQELFREQVRVEKITQLRKQSRDLFRQGDFVGGARTLRQARELEAATAGTARNASNIFFTFRRLVGILAVFTLARQAVQGFQQLVGLGLRFGDTLASAQTSIAGIVLATGELRDEFGDTVKGAEALARAEAIAGKQIRLLRQDALRTTATFEELLSTFQIAVGPGIAAGLNLDEIRQLSVSISQAATAIGLPQNQLAEEIRSLLSGTIQARTTRIATVLGISNADIRRLQETGELFEFLEERFAAFADSAQKQARSTLVGIRALVQGALGEVLGQAAQPLRDELLDVLNQVLDDVLLVQDELGNVAPRPEVVQAFRSLFDALRSGVERARELGESLGFEGLQDILGAIGSGLTASIEFVLGFAEGILVAFREIKSVIDAIANALGLSNRDLGRIAGVLGTIVAAMFVWNNTAGLVGLRIGTILNLLLSISKLLVGALIRNFSTLVALSGRFGRNLLALASNPIVLVAAGIAALLKGTELWFEKVLDVELGFKDVAELISIGVIEAIDDAIALARLLIAELEGAVDAPGEAVAGVAQQLGDIGLGFLAGLGIEDAQLALQQSLEEQAGVVDGMLKDETERERKVRETKEQILAELEARRELRRLAIEGIQSDSRDREAANAEGTPGFEGFDPDAVKTDFEGANAGAEEFSGTLSNANQVIRELAEGMLRLQDELRASQVEFEALSGTAGLQGTAGNVARIFTQAEVDNAERLRKITLEQRNIQAEITRLMAQGAISEERLAQIQDARRIQDPAERQEALTGLNLTAEESTLVSLLRDKLDLSEAIRESQRLQNDLVIERVAIIARQELPGLQQENQVLAATAEAQERINASLQGVVGQRQRELIAAQQAFAIAQQEEAIASQNRAAELAFLREKAALAEGDELAEIQTLIAALETRATLEERIAAARLAQLQFQQQQAALVANGTFGEGLREGFNDILEELPTAFEQGVAIIKGSVAQLSAFISESIVSAFDPTNDTTITEKFARFLQSIATLILNQIVQLLIATAIAKAFGVPLPGDATPPPAIPGVADGGEVPAQGYAKGGKVRNSRARPSLAHFTPGVRGFAGGGQPRDPRDTVPAFLQPGEFVVRKRVVDDLGVGFFEAVNNGRFTPEAAPVSAPSSSRAASAGMQAGGLVTDRVQQLQASQGENNGGGVTVVPAVVARDREMDQLTSGGRNALLAFMRENASDISALLNRDASRR